MRTLKDLDKDEIEKLVEFYKTHSQKMTASKFNVSEYTVSTILERRNITKHSKQENAVLTNLELYGTENVSRVKKIKDKIKDTKLERYGNPNYSNPAKTKQTCLKKYGTPSASGNPVIREKINKTNLERRGIENPFKDSGYIKSKCAEKYGTYDNFLAYQSDKRKESLLKKYGVENISQLEGSRVKALESMKNTCMAKYGVEYPTLLPQCQYSKGYSSNSTVNIEFSNLLSENNIYFEREYTLSKFSYDFKVNNILIEVDPFATHNSTWSPFGESSIKKKDYHYNKSKAANDAGFRCIHIFDWDDKQKIINILKPRQRIFARNCTVSELDIPTAKQYLNEHHLQGYARDSIRLGLFYNNELVSCMTFGKPRYNKNYEYELIRFCSHFQVVGGPEKLFKYFTNKYKPTSIISYCDDSKFTGELYSKLGFKYKDTTIGKHWYNPKFDSHITDNLLRQRGFDQLFGTSFGKGTRNSDLMKEHGFIEIYDAGQSSYIKKF